ncbi:hypothetical protein PRIPAC_78257 [Pristionchus pacificus]|uniref:Uncharacterized protein n=1 Tax=Pristionchus pacificus TaxID=54126 RepID=A0A2A6CQR1_PRIPA|nr:hypothetical protein PRIPAC_78257 [Pristionchus pacificus]|eukprot:PDM80371.1 hypothetical protein PRIPAC_32950 [Pristionchus pacificus]
MPWHHYGLMAMNETHELGNADLAYEQRHYALTIENTLPIANVTHVTDAQQRKQRHTISKYVKHELIQKYNDLEVRK